MHIKIEDFTESGIPKGSALSIFNKIEELKLKQVQTGLLQDSTVVQLPSMATTSTTNGSPQTNRPLPTPKTPSSGTSTPTSTKPPSYDDDESGESDDRDSRYREIISNPNKKTDEEAEDDKELARDLEDRPTSAGLNVGTTSGASNFGSKSASTGIQSFNQVPEAPLWAVDEFSANQKQSKFLN